MEIVVKPGELMPVDGVVTAGSSSMSEADLTGEPIPVHKTPGALVLSGSVNLDGVLEVHAIKRSAESKYAQIVRLVAEAQSQKAPIHRLADRYSIGFTIAAVAIAGLAWAISGDSVYALAVKATILLTGDSEVVAQQIGKIARVDRVVSRCLPEDKVRVVKELVEQGHHVLMVGDGINDAPALASATVGMALGSQGLTAAATAADTVLLSTDLLRVGRAVFLGRRVMRVARQGIWVGMGLT